MFFLRVTILSCLLVAFTLAAPRSLKDIKYPLSRDEAFHKLKDRSDFIFDFYHPRPMDIINGADAGQTVRAKGTNFPMLINNGLSMSFSIIYPCGVVLPHIHPRASQSYYILKGKFEVGFIEENGSYFIGETIEEGQGTIVPQGSIHYFINTGCTNASLVAVANSEDPGRIDIATSFFGVLPKSIVNAALGGQKVDIDKKKIPTVDPAKGTEECQRRCKLERS